MKLSDLVGLVAPIPAAIGRCIASAAKSLRWSVVVIVGLAFGLAVQTVRLDGLHITPKAGPFHFTLVSVEGWRPRAQTAETALAEVKAAQPKAEAAQAAENSKPAVITGAIAKEADAQTPDYLRRVAVAAAAHAVPSVGLCGARNVDGGAIQADLRGEDRVAQGDDDKAGSPDMVSVARADWEKLNAEAALRVQLYQVGQQWIAEGVAVADDTPDAAAPADQGKSDDLPDCGRQHRPGHPCPCAPVRHDRASGLVIDPVA
jgi:hypothetical protein